MKKLVTSLFRKSSDSNLSKSVKLRMETLESRQLLDAAGLAFANDADVVAVDTVVVAAPIDEAVDVSSVADSEAPAVELSTDSPVLGARITTIKAANTNFSYQWYAGYSADAMQPISGATFSYYSPSYPQIGMYIGVEATNADGETTTLTTANTVVWNLASVSISGDALIGTELTASVKPTVDAVAKRMAPDAPIAPEVSYQWYRVTDDGDVAIEGATDAKYTASFDDVGFSLKVVATGVGAFGGEVSAVTDIIEAQGLHLSTTSPKLGQRITSRLNPADSYTKYQWYYGTNADDMTAIPGAVYSYFSATYKYIGYKLQLVATYQRGEMAGTSVESVVTNPVYRTAVGPAVSFESDGVLATTGVDDEAAVVVTTDAPIVGARVKASVSTGDRATWQWYADGAAISKATASYYTPSAAMAGKVLSVTATLADGQEISTEVGTVTRKLSKVTINDFVPVAGLTMTAYTSPVTQSVSAQWYRVTDEGDVAIDGANTLKYTLKAEDVGYKLKLVVTGEDAYSGTVEQTTAVPVLATSPLTISVEEAELGVRLTTKLNPADQYAKFQWYRKVDDGWEWINGATYSYYTASYNGVGEVFRVVATYKTGEYAGLRASAVTNVVTRRISSVTLNSTTPEIGVPLKATVKVYGADVDYQWYRVSQTGKTFAIAGATKSTYTPTVDDSQYAIRVVATGKGNYSGTVEATTENVVDHTPVILSSDSPILGQRQLAKVTLSESYPTYQWYYGTSEADMTPISGATYSYFTPSYKHVGYSLQVKASYTSGPLAGLSYMSDVTNPITRRTDVSESEGVLATTSAVLDSEAPAVELSTDSPVLGARITTIKAANTNFSYQWYAGYSADSMQPISGATFSYYSPSYPQIGMYIGVEATNADGETTTLTTANTVVWNLASVSISGDALIGTELTASVKPTVDAVAKRMAPDAPIAPEVSYQWYRVTDDGDVAIEGATDAKYTASFDDVGFSLKVVATGVGAFGGEVSAVTDIIEAQGLHLSTTSPKLGQRITSRLNPADSYTKYQWYYGTNADDMTAIPGAVYSYFSATYKYIGYKLQLVATYQRGEMAGTSVESVVTNPVYRTAVGPAVSFDSGISVGDDSQEEGDDLSESILETIALGLI